MKIREYPSQNEIKELFEHRDGNLYWKKNRKGKIRDITIPAGSLGSDGYRTVAINYRTYKVHRLIWIYHNGNIPDGLEIDHINRIKNDNRIENLRLANRSVNNLNTNSKNVYFIENIKSGKKWQARIMINGKKLSKCFYSEQDATKWIEEKKSEIFQELS